MDRINTAVRAGPPVNDLVTRAGNGDKQAWDTLVERPIEDITREYLSVAMLRQPGRAGELLAAIGGSY